MPALHSLLAHEGNMSRRAAEPDQPQLQEECRDLAARVLTAMERGLLVAHGA